MVQVNPITDRLNVYAKRMIDSTSQNEPVRKMYIQNFLRTANDNDAHGTAIISYFTALNNARKNVNYNNHAMVNRLEHMADVIEKEVAETPALKEQVDKFTDAVNKKYKNSLEDRIALAKEGAVVSDGIEPKSRIKKIMAFLNQFMKEEE